MAASKNYSPKMPAPREKKAPAAPTLERIRAGMGDVDAEFVEVWTDEEERRATGLLSILGEDGRADPASLPALSPATLKRIYLGMVRIRTLDDRLMTLQRQGRIGFYAEARGQEASVIGSVAALDDDDFVVPAHRELGAVLYRGLPVRSFVAQLLGNANDISKGRQMPVHPGAPRALRFLPPSSCVATQLPQATGIAWAAKILKHKTVVMGYLGEGGTSAEDFHAGMNFAAVYRTPVVFLCQNNQWAISTPATAQTASTTFAIKALAYGMAGVRVDGNDVLAVYAAAKEAVDRARRGEGPTLIEAVTYRLGAHSTSDDPSRYRDDLTVEWTRKDPISRFRSWLLAQAILDEKADSQLRAEVDTEVKEAIAAEESVGPPPIDSLIEDVFAEPTAALREQLADLKRVRAKR
jgi:pyruvate dehydrogenase E1 component alpha subunit/2-oxoisovalerate dehydrogenase E1 component alpha subunit